MEPRQQQRQPVVDAYIVLFNQPPGTRAELARLVSADVNFSDPFNQLRGVDAVHALLADFAERVSQPRFDIQRQAWAGDTCFLRWRMQGQVAILGAWDISGVTELSFDQDDRISSHVDYWDAAGQLYERLPLIGGLLRLLRRRLRVPA